MHDVILKGLEDYLGGSSSREFDAHLVSCNPCGQEVRRIRETSSLLGALQTSHDLSESVPEAPPSFYASLASRIDSQRKQSFWSLFSVDPAFGRRVVFASLMTLGVLGGVLVTQERSFTTESTPESILAHDGSVPHVDGADRDRMFITLATYNH